MSTPAQAATLAAELARLMDMVETEGVSLDGLAALVPETFSAHWQQTLDFLKIVTEAWPAHLAEQKLLSAAGRRNAVIRAEARRLTAMPPKGPVIVAGVTGSIPGDRRADARRRRAFRTAPSFCPRSIRRSTTRAGMPSVGQPDHPEHPQFGLKKLLDGLGVTRRDVAILSGADESAVAGARARVCRRGDAPLRHDRALAGLCGRRAHGQGAERARGPEPHRGADGPGRGRGRLADPAPGGRDAGPDGRACLARPPACAPRRRPPRSLGHQGRQLGRPPVREDGARRVPRSHPRGRRQELCARRADGAPEASADPPRPRSVRGAPRGACARDRGLPHALPRRGPRRRRRGARACRVRR